MPATITKEPNHHHRNNNTLHESPLQISEPEKEEVESSNSVDKKVDSEFVNPSSSEMMVMAGNSAESQMAPTGNGTLDFNFGETPNEEKESILEVSIEADELETLSDDGGDDNSSNSDDTGTPDDLGEDESNSLVNVVADKPVTLGDIKKVNGSSIAKENSSKTVNGEAIPDSENKKVEVEESSEGKRLTDMVDPAKDGGAERMQSKVEGEQGVISENLTKLSDKSLKKGYQKINQLSSNEKKKESPAKKLSNINAAVEEKAADKEAESKVQQAVAMDGVAKPEVKPDNPAKVLQDQLKASLPTDLEEATKFSSSGKAKAIGNKVSDVIKNETKTVEATYQQIEETPTPAQPKASEPLNAIEPIVETPALQLSDGLVPEVENQKTDLSEFKDESDKVMEREGISQEQLDMVDSGDLAEANKNRKEIDTKVKEEPTKVKQFENNQRQKVSNDLSKEEQQEKKAMRTKRQYALKGAKEGQKRTKSKLELQREQVTQKINSIYTKAETEVKNKLAQMEEQSLAAFDKAQQKATTEFEDRVNTRMNSFKAKRYSGFWAGAKWLKDKILGMDDLPEVKQIFESEKNIFITKIDAAIKTIIAESQGTIRACKDIITKARKEIDKYVKGLSPALKKTGLTAQKGIKEKLDKLDKEVNQAAEKLKNKLQEKRAAAIKAIEEKIEKMKAAMSGLLAQLGNFLLDAMMKFFKWALSAAGYKPEEIMSIIDKGKSVITAIVTDPIGFISNLIDATKGGINNFQANIKQHLIGGMMSWLTGAMGDLPIQLPETLDLKGIISVSLQVMGLTWDNLRNKLVKRVGEPVVKAAETGVDIVRNLISGGPMALWEMVKEKAVEIKETVMEGIRNWAITELVKQGIIKLLSFLNPAGAIVQAILAIYNTIMFFVENWQRIVDFVGSIFNSIGEIAAGKIGAASKFIENALAKTIPIILNFLARLLNISGISKAIQKIMGKIRKPVDKVVNKTLDFISNKAKKIFGKKKGKKGDAKKIKEENKKDKDKVEVTAKDKALHKKIAANIFRKLKAKKVKDQESYEQYHARLKTEGEELEDKYQPQLKKNINLDVKFKSAKADKADNDIDVNIRIAPNTLDVVEDFFYEPEESEEKTDKEFSKKVEGVVIDKNKQPIYKKAKKSQSGNLITKYFKTIRAGVVKVILSKAKYGIFAPKLAGEGIHQMLKVFKNLNNKKSLLGKVTIWYQGDDVLHDAKGENGIEHPVYRSVETDEQRVRDSKGIKTGRYGTRATGRDDESSINDGQGIFSKPRKGDDYATKKSEHIVSTRDGSAYVSTAQGKEQVLGSSGRPFNNIGGVDLDYAKIKQEDIHALHNKEGIQKHLFPEYDKDQDGQPIITNVEQLQSLIDVYRTNEVLIGNQHGKSEREKDHSKKEADIKENLEQQLQPTGVGELTRRQRRTVNRENQDKREEYNKEKRERLKNFREGNGISPVVPMKAIVGDHQGQKSFNVKHPKIRAEKEDLTRHLTATGQIDPNHPNVRYELEKKLNNQGYLDANEVVGIIEGYWKEE